MSQKENCQYEYCQCTASAKNGYCSESCALAAQNLNNDEICHCGHLDCSGVVIALTDFDAAAVAV